MKHANSTIAWKSYRLTTMEGESKEDGGLGALPPGKSLEPHPLECRKTPFWRIGIFIIDLFAEKENWSSNLETKDEQAMLTLAFAVACL